MSLKTNLEAAALRSQVDTLRREVGAVAKERDYALRQLDAARATPRVKLKAAPARKKRKGDRVRVIIPDTHGAKADLLALAALLADMRRVLM